MPYKAEKNKKRRINICTTGCRGFIARGAKYCSKCQQKLSEGRLGTQLELSRDQITQLQESREKGALNFAVEEADNMAEELASSHEENVAHEGRSDQKSPFVSRSLSGTKRFYPCSKKSRRPWKRLVFWKSLWSKVLEEARDEEMLCCLPLGAAFPHITDMGFNDNTHQVAEGSTAGSRLLSRMNSVSSNSSSSSSSGVTSRSGGRNDSRSSSGSYDSRADQLNYDSFTDRSESSTSSYSTPASSESESIPEDEMPLMCGNCRRAAVMDQDSAENELLPLNDDCGAVPSVYHLGIAEYNVPTSLKNRKYCLVNFAAYAVVDNVAAVNLCSLCKESLLHGLQENNAQLPKCDAKVRYAWPSIVWMWLMSYEMLAFKMLPEEWRVWWEEPFLAAKPHLEFAPVPPSLFKDVTMKLRRHNFRLERNVAKDLVATLKEDVMLQVKCPWGCDEYLHKVGKLNFDTFIGHYLDPRSKFPVSSVTKDMQLYKGIRPDYFEGKVFLLLENPELRVMPSIAFFDGVPKILTCCDHNAGDKYKYVHAPNNPYGPLPSPNGNQLAAARVAPRTLKSTRRNMFSNTHCMMQLQGGFEGVDSFRVTEPRNFLVTSELQAKHESLTIQGRSDIRAMVSQWQTGDGPVDSSCAQGLLERAEEQIPNTEGLVEYLSGATYVTLYDALLLQATVKRGEQTAHVVRRFINVPGAAPVWQEVQQIPFWPPCIIHCHPYDSHGACFHNLPTINLRELEHVVDARLLWYMFAIHVTAGDVWRSTCSRAISSETWEGWLLAYVSQESMGRKPPSKEIFKMNRVGTGQLVRNLMIRMGMLRNGGAQQDAMQQPPHHNEALTAGPPLVVTIPAPRGDGDNNNVNRFQLEVDMQAHVLEDGEFHPQHLHLLFQNHPKVIVVQCQHAFDPNVIVPGTNALVLYRKVDSYLDANQVVPLPDEVEDDYGEMWELRMIGDSQTSERPERPDKWTGIIYARHGIGFCGWWTYCHNSLIPTKHDGPLPDDQRRLLWDVAVYVRAKTSEVSKIREQILTYSGGQTKTRCSVHNMFLVVASTSTQLRCACEVASRDDMGGAEPCGRRALFRCGNSECSACICRVHQDQLLEPTTIEPVDDLQEGIDVLINADHEDAEAAFADVLEQARVELEDDQIEMIPTFNAEVPLDFDDASSLASTSSIDSFLSNVLNNNADPPLPAPVGGPEEVVRVPTTHAGIRATVILPREQTQSISGYVIMNIEGSLLARKHRKFLGNRYQKNYVQRIAAQEFGHTVPLCYAEGILFPSIFWKDLLESGAIVGALPTGLMSSDSNVNKNGFAGIGSHVKARIKNTSLQTSTDESYKTVAFDMDFNHKQRHHDSRMVMHRGITNPDYNVTKRGNGTTFYADSVDSKPTVSKLAAAVGEEQATYFLTLTCNQRDCPGMSKLKQWIDSDAALAAYGVDLDNANEATRKEVQLQIAKASAVIVLQQWMEVSDSIMKWIATSDEQPLGLVERIWYRYEFQDTKGNLPHIHCLLWIEDGQLEANQPEVLERIRGHLKDMIRFNEVEVFIEKGIIESWDEFPKVQELAERVLTHTCSDRCKKRIGTKDGETSCRIPNNGALNPTPQKHCVLHIPVVHSEEAAKVLERIGLMEHNEVAGHHIPRDDVPEADILKARKHIPPAILKEGKVSPVNGLLFALTRSSQNLQKCDGFLCSRYVAKYASAQDEHNKVLVGANPHDFGKLQADFEFLHNTKISGSAIQEAKRASMRRDSKHPNGRAISEMEMLTVILGYPIVHTNIYFKHIPTVPLEERPGKERAPAVIEPYLDAEDLDAHQLSASVYVRNSPDVLPDLPLWRRLGPMDIRLISDALLHPFSLCANTVFSLRPPELRWVRNPQLFFRWFSHGNNALQGLKGQQRFNMLKSLLNINSIYTQPWIDLQEKQIHVRRGAVEEILPYLEARQLSDFYPFDAPPPRHPEHQNPKHAMTVLFRRLHTAIVDPPVNPNSHAFRATTELCQTFFNCSDGRLHHRDLLPVIWLSNVKPTQPGRWLLHILWSLGEYCNELHLQNAGTIKEAFIRAKLLRAQEEHHEEDILRLLKRYVVEQLAFLPGGTKQFDRDLLAAHSTLLQGILCGTLPLMEIPPCLYTHIQQETSDKVKMHIFHMKLKLVETTLRKLHERNILNLPPIHDLMEATSETPLPWIANLEQSATQSLESVAEQTEAMNLIRQQLDQYQSGEPVQTRSTVLVGGPGVGKTTLLQLCVIEQLARGLKCGMSAILAERANEMGGMHLAKFFCIPANKSATPARLAQLALIALQRQPQRIAFIKQMDILNLDEFGNFSAELIAVLDIILRWIRQSSAFMGGVLLICTCDNKQLNPINGRPPLMSAHVLTSFKFIFLTQSVRAGGDASLQEIQRITRIPADQLTEGDLDNFKSLIETCCTHVSDWNDAKILPHYLRIFGKKAAKHRAEEVLLNQMKFVHAHNMRSSVAIDLESTLEGDWRNASIATTRSLSRAVKEPSELFFYELALYEITYNSPDGSFSQSQLAVLLELPTRQQLQTFQPIRVAVAPCGTKCIPPDIVTAQQLVDQYRWTPITIGAAPERAETLRIGIQAKRQQYGLRHRIASTIHAAMGQDLTALVTRVSSLDPDYYLWEKAQVVVLLSRTFKAKQIIFVGDPAETSEALATLLRSESQFGKYTSDVLHRIAIVPGQAPAEHVPALIDNTTVNLHPYLPCDVTVPCNNSGFCYLLVSLRLPTATYIGQTSNLYRRFMEHNSGMGAVATASVELRPWGLLAYVCGFEGNRHLQRAFEGAWKHRRDYLMDITNAPLNPNQVAIIGAQLIQNIGWLELHLRYVKCGVVAV